MAKWTIDPCNGYVNTAKTPCECDDGVWEMLPDSLNKTFSIINENGQSISYTRTKTCCNCNSIQYKISGKWESNYVGNNAQTFNPAIELGTIETKPTCSGKLNLSVIAESQNDLTLFIENNKVYLRAIVKNDTNLPRALKYYIYADGVKCDECFGYVYQQCWRGTDNGTEFYIEDTEIIEDNSPILLCGFANYETDDTIKVENIMLVGASASSTNCITDTTTCASKCSNYHSLDSYVRDLDFNTLWSVDLEWLNVYKITGGSCNFGSLKYRTIEAYNENTQGVNENVILRNRYRSILLKYKTTAVKIGNENACSEGMTHRSEPCCQEWIVEVRQCKQNYAWFSKVNIDGNAHSKTSIPCSRNEFSDYSIPYHSCGR